MLCVSTAKAYFPDRQSCSTLCRQPFGCARSVEVVAVYPSLGSYSVVGLFRWASPLFKKPFTLNAKLSGQIYTFLQNFFGKLLFAQNHLLVLCSTTSRKLTPPLVPTGRGQNEPWAGNYFYLCCFAQIKWSVFERYSVLKVSLHLYPMGEVIF